MFIFHSSHNFFAMQKPLFPALLFALLLAFGCGKSPDNNGPDGLNGATWSITYYNDKIDKVEDTGVFNGYSFEFNDNDEWIIHTPAGDTQTAKWAYDANTGSFSLSIVKPFVPIDQLLGDWKATVKSDTEIKLEGLGPIDVFDQNKAVTFKKD